MASPETARLSLAAAITLGLKRGRFYRDAKPGCINLLMEYDEGCLANCMYCGQARSVSLNNPCKNLIRVHWPSYPLREVIRMTEQASSRDRFIQRICIASITHPRAADDMILMVEQIRASLDLEVSALITPTIFCKDHLRRLVNLGVNNITVAVDTATPELFHKLRGQGCRGPHTWERYLFALREIQEVRKNGLPSLGVHLIAGLGETEEEAICFIQTCYDIGARVHLFSFYPERGSALEDRPQPDLMSYRRIQLGRYLIDQGLIRADHMSFTEGNLIDFGLTRVELLDCIRSGIPFMTSGCPGCNRPYANETPGQASVGSFRNYPFPPTKGDIHLIEAQMGF